MERSRQQVTDDAGEKLLRGSLPGIWVVRKVQQSEDYGIDFEIEVFSDEGGSGRSTGFIFKVQLKSSANPAYSKSKPTVSVSLKKKHIAYYCAELDEPVIIIHADVTAKRLFWLAPQLKKELQHQGDPRSSKKVSVGIPVENELPATLRRMLRDADRAATSIATRRVVSTPIPELLSALHPEDRDEELAQSLRDRSDAIRLGQLQELFLARNHERAETIINRMLHDSETSIENKYWALLEQERITLRKLADTGAPQAHRPDATLEIANQLQNLTKSGPAPLKFSALITLKAAELDVLTHRAFGLLMNYQIHSRSGNELWRTYAQLEKTQTELHIWRKYNQCVRLARYVSMSKHRTATCGALIRIVHGLVVYLIVLDSEEKHEQALQYRKSGFQILQLAAWIAQRIGDHTALTLAASSGIQLAHSDFTEPFAWADRTVASIDDAGERATAEKLVGRAKARKSGIPQEGDIPYADQQVYENMATALGIPLDDQNHILTMMFRAGVKDADPTRVLRHCKHSFASLGRISMFQHMMGEQLGLPIGPKVFECAKHGYGVIAGSLDEAYRLFNSRYCQSCPDREAQPENWKHSQEWQAKQYRLVLETRKMRQEAAKALAAAQRERVLETLRRREKRPEVAQPVQAASEELIPPNDEGHESQ